MNPQPFTFRNAGLLLIVFSLISSCSDDDNNSNALATIVVPETSLSANYHTWIFLTDDEGAQLGDAQRANEGTDLVFARPEGFKGTTFTLHKVGYSADTENTFFEILSYTNVKSGTFTLPKVNRTRVDAIGEAHVVVNNVPAVYQPRLVGAGIFGANITSGGGTFDVKTSVRENDQWALCYVSGFAIDGRVPRYAYFNSIVADETKTVSFTDLPEASHKTVTFDTEVDIAQITIGVANGNMDFYNIYNTTSAPVYYPEEVTADYSTNIVLYDGNDYRAYYTIGEIPTAMKTLSATINSLESGVQQVSISTSGAYDYLTLQSSESWEDGGLTHHLSWRVYMNDAAEKNFAIPILPGEIIADYPQLTGIPQSFDLVTLTETNKLSGYSDFIKQSIKGDQSSKPLIETLVFRRAFSLSGRESAKTWQQQFEE